MTQAALIQALCDDLTPVTPLPPARLLMRGALVGGGVALAGLMATLGVQSGLDQVPAFAVLLLKLGTMTALAGLTLRSLAALARPGATPFVLLPGMALIGAVLGFVALGQMLVAHESGAMQLLFGPSWQSCPWRITALSLPLLAGLFWALRQQAPVHLGWTGAVAGLAAGSIAAAVYALACSEKSAAFILLWYSAGIGASTLLGLVTGPRLLRW